MHCKYLHLKLLFTKNKNPLNGSQHLTDQPQLQCLEHSTSNKVSTHNFII